jgi:cell division protease FtsH
MIFLGREIHENRDYSETVAVKIDVEIDALIANGLKSAQEIIETHRDAMIRVADALVQKETLERADFYGVIGLPPANPKNAI